MTASLSGLKYLIKYEPLRELAWLSIENKSHSQETPKTQIEFHLQRLTLFLDSVLGTSLHDLVLGHTFQVLFACPTCDVSSDIDATIFQVFQEHVQSGWFDATSVLEAFECLLDAAFSY